MRYLKFVISSKLLIKSIKKTKAWIKATKISKLKNINWIIKNNKKLIKFILNEEIKIIKICPTVIFTINRIPKIIGRVNCLINSIIITNGIKNKGVLEGTKKAIVLKKFFNTQFRYIFNQKNNPIPKLNLNEAVKEKK